MGRVLHETAGREKSKRKGKNRDEEVEEVETNKETEKEKGIGERRSAEWNMDVWDRRNSRGNGWSNERSMERKWLNLPSL
jgi:hypothetical protein